MALILRLIFVPGYSLFSRIWKGEGALLALTAALVMKYENPGGGIWIKITAISGAIALMYGLNDIHDAPFDTRDEARRNTWSLILAQSQKTAYAIHVFENFGFIGVCLIGKLINIPAYAAAVLLSAGYSLWAKTKPGFDFLAVFLWGPAFILAFAGQVPLWYLLNTGFMLVMSHAFQMSRDRRIDAENKIMTSAVRSPLLMGVIFYGAAGAVIAGFLIQRQNAAAAISTACAVLPLWGGFRKQVWLLVKAGQVCAWLAALL